MVSYDTWSTKMFLLLLKDYNFVGIICVRFQKNMDETKNNFLHTSIQTSFSE
jgi:hypothetical protein